MVVETKILSYLSPQAILPSPTRENRKTKFRNKRDVFISDNGFSKELREWKSDGVGTNFIRE